MSGETTVAPPPLLAVPAGTPDVGCRGCGRSVYMVKSALSGKLVPVTCHTVFEYKGAALGMAAFGVRHPTADADGLGWNHFIDCPRRDQFRKPTQRPTLAETAIAPPPAGRRPRSAPRDTHIISYESHLTREAGCPCTAPGCAEPPVAVVLCDGRLWAVLCEPHAGEWIPALAKRTPKIVGVVDAPSRYLASRDHPKWREHFISRSITLRESAEEAGGLAPPAPAESPAKSSSKSSAK